MPWTKQQQWLVVGGVIVIVLLLIFGMSRIGKREAAARAFENLAKVGTFHTQAELLINLPTLFRGQERPFTKTIMRVEGDVARADDQTPEFTGSLYLEARGRGNIFFADGQARILRDRVLFNLDTLPVFLNPSGSLVKHWTKVVAPVMQVKNRDQVREVLQAVMKKAKPAGKESLEGERLARFSLTLSDEEEKMVADVLRRTASGSPALHVLARLLDANVMNELTVWVDGGEVRQVRAHFVRPIRQAPTSAEASAGKQGKIIEFDFATLTLRFTDYNKEVVIEAPETRRVVRPDVFSRLFGGGKTEEIKVERE